MNKQPPKEVNFTSETIKNSTRYQITRESLEKLFKSEILPEA